MHLYEVLGLGKKATKDEIKSAFRRLSKLHHPDVNGGTMSEEYHKIVQAHAVLSKEEDRRIYDATGHDPGTDGAREHRKRH